MANLPIPAPLSEVDYEQIESAVMETARGRWFLAEYARRNRNADTTMLLKALERIEGAMRGQHSVEPVERIRFDLVEMSKAIARTKTEIASMKPDSDHHGKFGEASEELDSVVQATETATSDILACAERIQEMAWTLREQGVEAEVCDLLDANATEVYTACSFQDITGQRTRKVIGVLRYLEERINAMISIWGLDGAMSAEAAETRAVDEGKSLLNGPAKPGHGMDQADVDMVMGPAARRDAPARQAAAPMAAVCQTHIETQAHREPAHRHYQPAPPLQPVEESHAAPMAYNGYAARPSSRPYAYEADATVIDAEVIAEPVVEAKVVEAKPVEIETPRPAPRQAAPTNDALAPVMALSADERIALFT
jgi:chemotaxis regulatin CheY-phosphate phosphatase CheZ